MRWGAFLCLPLMAGNAMADPLAEALERFQALNSYQATVRSLAAGDTRQVIRYFYRKPGWVRMEFVQPHPGALLVYDPGKRRVRLWPFGLERALVLSLDPDNPLIRGPHGHRVDRSDVGALLENLLALRARGSARDLGRGAVFERPAVAIEVAGAAGLSVAGVHRYQVWLAEDSLFPLRVKSFAVNGNWIETVDLLDVLTGVRFPGDFFTP